MFICGLFGACRREDLYNLKANKVNFSAEFALFHIPPTENKRNKYFVVTGKSLNILKKYAKLRPKNCKSDHFFIKYTKGKCCNQVVGINKIASVPKEIAQFLKLKDPHLYTDHAFRRSAFTTLVEPGGKLEQLKAITGWKSNINTECNIPKSSNIHERIYTTVSESLDPQISLETFHKICGTNLIDNLYDGSVSTAIECVRVVKQIYELFDKSSRHTTNEEEENNEEFFFSNEN